MSNVNHRDQHLIWHPFTQHQTAHLPITIRKGKGAYLFDDQGNSLLDLISSWWVNLHGHAHPDIAKAIYEQALQLEHVIFSHFTHEPAVVVAEKLLEILPPTFKKIFYSDNGSTAVEVALKMVYQYWRNVGEPQRQRFIAFEGGYHGDTFGAMAVGKRSDFFSHFENLLFGVDFFPYPETWLVDEEIESKEQHILKQIEQHLSTYKGEIAGIIIEPLVQGASGMRMCRPQFLQNLEQMMKREKILVIYDEVMTGFGRTGANFASLKANTLPDIICLAKGLTGGFLPLAVTACTDEIYQAFLGDTFDSALTHGHSFTANPLGCAAAIASLNLLTQKTTQTKIKEIEAIHHFHLTNLKKRMIEHPRYCGTIAAFNLKMPSTYGSAFSIQLRDRFLQRGLLVRPLGNVIYFLPPYCITPDELSNAYQLITNELEEVAIC